MKEPGLLAEQLEDSVITGRSLLEDTFKKCLPIGTAQLDENTSAQMDQEDRLIHPATQPLDSNTQAQHSEVSSSEMNLSLPDVVEIEPVTGCSSAVLQQHEVTKRRSSASTEGLDQLTSSVRRTASLKLPISSASCTAEEFGEVLQPQVEGKKQSKDNMACQGNVTDQNDNVETLKMSLGNKIVSIPIAAHGQVHAQSTEDEGICKGAVQDAWYSKSTQGPPAETGSKALPKQIEQGSSERHAESLLILPRASTALPENDSSEHDSLISAAAKVHDETEETSSCKNSETANEDQTYIVHYNVLADEGRPSAIIGDMTMEADADARQPSMSHSMSSQPSAEQSADDVEEIKVNLTSQDGIAAAAETKLEDLEDSDKTPSTSSSIKSECSEGIDNLGESTTQEAGQFVAEAVRALFARATREAENETAITQDLKVSRISHDAHQDQPAEEDSLPEQDLSITKDDVCLQSEADSGDDMLEEPCQEMLHRVTNQSCEEVLMPQVKCFVTDTGDREENESNSHSSSPEGSETLPQNSQQSSGNNAVDQDFSELPTSLRDSDIQTSQLAEQSIAIKHSKEIDSVAATNDILSTSSDALGESHPLESPQRECLSEVSRFHMRRLCYSFGRSL